LRKELIANHFVEQIKEAGRGYGHGRGGETIAMPDPAATPALPAT